jgi:hypothetical protein
MNTYYSNFIEGHDTRPRDIERALAGEFDRDPGRRNLQIEAAAHVRLQSEIISWRLKGDCLSPPRPTSFDGYIASFTEMPLKSCSTLGVPVATSP